MELKIERTRTHLPCLWEKGGGMTRTGFAVVICDYKGEPKTPIFVRTRGHLACESHALIPVAVGDVVISVNRNRDKFNTFLYAITAITGDIAVAEEIIADTTNYAAAIAAAMEKTMCYHCRHPHFVADNVNVRR